MEQDNIVQPFQLEESRLRGRGVRLGSVLDDILQAHDYPYPVAHMVAETVSLAILLSSMLKYDGIFTLQARGDGPVHLLVADVLSNGDVRGCAHFDAERLEVARASIAALKTPEGSVNHLAQYLGKGHMAFTVDQTDGKGRYQGIVELSGASLVDCAQHYFRQSEQIQTGIKLSAGIRDGVWRAGGIMIQNMPEDDGRGDEKFIGNADEDSWRRAMVFLDSCQDDEFLSTSLPMEDLLLRLFHEEGVRIYERHSVQKNCRCDAQRVQNVVSTLPEDDRLYLVKDGVIKVSCEFCAREYCLDPESYELIEG